MSDQRLTPKEKDLHRRTSWPRGSRPLPREFSSEAADYAARNKILRDMGFGNYKVYLESELWKQIRRAVLKRDQSTCFKCGKQAWMVHHVHYGRKVLEGKDLEAMLSVCGPCHRSIEIKPSGKKRSLQEAATAVGMTLTTSQTHPLRADGGVPVPTNGKNPDVKAEMRPRQVETRSHGVR